LADHARGGVSARRDEDRHRHLAEWQKLSVAAFLTSGIAVSAPESIGEPYEDGSGTTYLWLIGQPILICGADRVELTRALDRALARGVRPTI
jgi:hypothetical protein